MLLTLIVLIFIILYFLMYKKETFIKYDENVLFGLDKDKDAMYQLNLKLSKAKDLEKLIDSMEENNNAKIQNNNVVGMVLKKSCVPTEPKFVPPKKGYNEFSALDVTKDQHLENHEFKSLIDHLYSA